MLAAAACNSTELGSGDASSEATNFDGAVSGDANVTGRSDASSESGASSATDAAPGDASVETDGGPSDGQWIWNSNLPVAASFNGAWASAPNDAWVVGDGGAILHWNGSAWASVSSGTMNHLQAVWGASANNVWAVAVSVKIDAA